MNPAILRILSNVPEKYALDLAGLSRMASAAYAARRLTKYYSGAILRVRRSSDNAETDIGAVGENLDTAALLAFSGSNSAFVTTTYDQSGNANHATQATAANQPRIVNAGIIDRDFDATKASALYPTFASAAGVNIFSNGDFSGSTTGWSTTGGTQSVSGNTLSSTGNGTSAGIETTQSTNTAVTIGKRYYMRYLARVTNSSSNGIRLVLDGTTTGSDQIVSVSNPVQNQWYTLSGIFTVQSDFTGNIKVKLVHTYADSATANGKTMEVQEVVCVDVTELGQPCMYFDGTNDVLTIANSASVDITGQPIFMNTVFNNANQTGYVICKNLTTGSDQQYGILYTTSTQRTDMYLENSSRQNTGTNSTLVNTQYIYSSQYESNAQKGYVNGTSSGTAGTYNGALTSRANMQIGARSNNSDGTAFTNYFKGNISEIIIAPSTSGRSKLEGNQGKFYQLGVA